MSFRFATVLSIFRVFSPLKMNYSAHGLLEVSSISYQLSALGLSAMLRPTLQNEHTSSFPLHSALKMQIYLSMYQLLYRSFSVLQRTLTDRFTFSKQSAKRTMRRVISEEQRGQALGSHKTMDEL